MAGRRLVAQRDRELDLGGGRLAVLDLRQVKPPGNGARDGVSHGIGQAAGHRDGSQRAVGSDLGGHLDGLQSRAAD